MPVSQEYLIYSDKDIYDLGHDAFHAGQKKIPSFFISSIRQHASVTWLRGWEDAQAELEDTGLYGKALVVNGNHR